MTDKKHWKNQGAVHIYTGEGKGKTTAAIGLAMRACGANLNVRFIQFLKGGHYAEHDLFKQLKNLSFQQFGRDDFVIGQPRQEDYQEAQLALQAVATQCQDSRVDMVIADEIVVALALKLITEDEVGALIGEKQSKIELVMTGRGASNALIAKADLVTEFKAIKHYYHQGRQAKVGIEF